MLSDWFKLSITTLVNLTIYEPHIDIIDDTWRPVIDGVEVGSVLRLLTYYTRFSKILLTLFMRAILITFQLLLVQIVMKALLLFMDRTQVV